MAVLTRRRAKGDSKVQSIASASSQIAAVLTLRFYRLSLLVDDIHKVETLQARHAGKGSEREKALPSALLRSAMAAKKEFQKQEKKRKRNPKEGENEKNISKKPKQLLKSRPASKPPSTGKPFGKPLGQSKEHKLKASSKKPALSGDKDGPQSKRESRLRAKELAEARKKKRKPHYSLEQNLALLWEKMRRRNIAKEDRSKLITEALKKMAGKIPEIAGSHVSSRVLQTCVKYCSQPERDSVFEELKPHFLSLARNTYAVHLVKKMLDNVAEHAFQLGNGSQKQALLAELYSPELQLFKDLTTKEGRLEALISKLGLQKQSVLQHMSSVIQPILEKGIVDHSILHRALMEYLSIADKVVSVLHITLDQLQVVDFADVIQQLSGPLLVRMIHTRDGSRLGILCVKHGSTKERKKIIKGMKDHVGKIAHDQCGSMVLVCILSVIDDTKLLTKVIIRGLQPFLKELIVDKLSEWKAPTVAATSSKLPAGEKPDIVSGNLEKPIDSSAVLKSNNKDDDSDMETEQIVEGGKKDPSLRRFELLINSGLAESLADTCIDSAGELLQSNFGKDIVYEVATGGAGGILSRTLADKTQGLHESIATLASLPKGEKPNEHLFENFHSSRTLRKLVLDSPSFAATLWRLALEGKCESWAQGHSLKVVSAYLESSDSTVREMAKCELQSLIDQGILKPPETKQAAA
ncbi:hypothetical protein ACLOJK_026331 [Asimina triloba]